MSRVGLVGFGFIGAGLYRAISSGECKGLDVAFVWNRSREKLSGPPGDVVLNDLMNLSATKPDIVVESAHPDISREHGEQFLANSDYMPFSVTALADDELRERLITAAKKSDHHMVIPQGALVGTDALFGLAPYVA